MLKTSFTDDLDVQGDISVSACAWEMGMIACNHRKTDSDYCSQPTCNSDMSVSVFAWEMGVIACYHRKFYFSPVTNCGKNLSCFRIIHCPEKVARHGGMLC